MKKIAVIILLFFTILYPLSAQWKPAGNKIKTQWSENLDVNNIHPEYPRPIMERNEWKNLNGLWNYAIQPMGKTFPKDYDGRILVPFAIESSLSGVGKSPGNDHELWYQREFSISDKWKNKQILLHFGAVDWKADVWVNDVKVGTHTGGYTPFSFDITTALKKGKNELIVRVWDPTDKGFQPRGKQLLEPHGIWYTSVSGIWQTVWLEPVNNNYLEDIKITPDIDKNLVRIDPVINMNKSSGDSKVEVKIFDNDQLVAQGAAINNNAVEVQMPENTKLWSPDNPFLYTMQVSLYIDGKLTDEVKSYTAMRKYSMARDANGIMRMQLNNRNIFHFGTLDQGWWPDGLYTAPTDEALAYDIKKTKDWGFNMIRKHVKVEPARWYTHCDKLGMIVWQDMPNGEKLHTWEMKKYYEGEEFNVSKEAETNFRREWKDVMDYLYSYPSIAIWVPFNEAWGQFKTKEMAEWTKEYDPSRLVNPASGGNHYTCGDILDLHNYPGPELYLYDAQRVTVLGEYGGIGFAMKEHLWEPDRNWGYIQFNSSDEVTNEYLKYAGQLKQLVSAGFSAAVYTQTTDVEIEVNGLMTYDRKRVKVDEAKISKVNKEIINILK